MFVKGLIRSGTKPRRGAIIGATMTAIVSIPLVLWGYHSDPPPGESGAAVGNGGSTCSSNNACHFHAANASQVTAGVIAATGLSGTYTAGGAAIPITVTLNGNSFGFEMSAVSGSGTAEVQAATLIPAHRFSISGKARWPLRLRSHGPHPPPALAL